jgi:hypothetical protein
VFLLIIERTLTIEEAELCVRSSSYPFDVCSKKCRYGNWSFLVKQTRKKRGPTPVDILDWENDGVHY